MDAIPVIIGLISAANLIFAIFQFNEKGFLFNNAYIYASKEERAKMDKKPYYRQSAIVFLLISVLFALICVEYLTGSKWLYAVEGTVVVFMLIYAICSTVRIEKKK